MINIGRIRNVINKTILSTLLLLTPTTACGTGPADYSPYMDNSYNLRTSVVYTEPNNRVNLVAPMSSGTSFVLKKGIKSYFITSRHVVMPDGNKLSDDAKDSLKKMIYSIGTDRQDFNLFDDYNLRLVALDGDNDLALLEFRANTDGDITDSIRWIESPTKNIGDADIGNHAFAVGYKMEMKKTIQPGIVSSEKHHDKEAGNYFWTTIDGLPGLSGAPIYEMDNGVVELVGVATRISPNGTDTLAVEIKEAVSLLQRFLKHPGKERKNLEEMMGDYYDYIIH